MHYVCYTPPRVHAFDAPKLRHVHCVTVWCRYRHADNQRIVASAGGALKLR